MPAMLEKTAHWKYSGGSRERSCLILLQQRNTSEDFVPIQQVVLECHQTGLKQASKLQEVL